MKAEVEALLARRGGEEYAGEPVSQLEHALQCAALAEAEGAGPALVAAALLHDIGHLFDDNPDAVAAAGIDTRHEDVGEAWLAHWFGPEVTEPVRLHVDAKRWLCAREPGYLDALSPASVRSLALQGGPFSPEEADAWLARPHADAGLRLRRWDDAAKDPAAVTQTLAYYLDIAESVMR
ncbi:MAG: phosphonate degradation HD-domain oxygenase [Pseudomonadota bacterium]